MIIKFTNFRILKDDFLKEEDLWVKEKKIISPQSRADLVIDGKNKILSPGYIDLQINGGFGFDFTSQPESVVEVAQKLPKYGVTSFLPTIVSSPLDKYASIISSIRAQKQKQTSGLKS